MRVGGWEGDVRMRWEVCVGGVRMRWEMCEGCVRMRWEVCVGMRVVCRYD